MLRRSSSPGQEAAETQVDIRLLRWRSALGAIAQRWAGPAAGLVAAALYAIYPEAVGAERGPFLEPVLNLMSLSLAWVWLAPRALQSSSRRNYLPDLWEREN